MKINIRSPRPNGVFSLVLIVLGLLLSAGQSQAAATYALQDFYWPLYPGNQWIYRGTSPNAGDQLRRVDSVAATITCYTGKTKPTPYTRTAAKLHGAYGTWLGSDHFTPDTDPSNIWDDYVATGDAWGQFGDDEFDQNGTAGNMRVDPNPIVTNRVAVGQSITKSADAYWNGKYTGKASIVLKVLGVSTLTVSSGTYSNCLHLTISFTAGGSTSINEEWWAQGVGPVKMIHKGQTRELAFANIVVAPKITVQPLSSTNAAGSIVSLGVMAWGTAPLTYQWKLAGTNISPAIHMQGVASSSLTIQGFTAADAGRYTVIVASPYGSVTSSPAILSLLPPEKIKPTIVISAPKANLVVSNAVLIVQGTAKDNVAIGSVSYRVNSNGWMVAQGTSNWTGQVVLSPGANTVQSFATDTSGNVSPTLSAKVTYVPVAVLSVTLTPGLGSISGAVVTKTNTAIAFAVGKQVTLTATAAKGQTFLGWSGLTNSTSATIKFTMPAQGADLTAQFSAPPSSGMAGTYEGLIMGMNPFDLTNAGAFSISVTAGGAYSAKLMYLSQTNSASGQLTLAPGTSGVSVGKIPFKIGGQNVMAIFDFVPETLGYVAGSVMATGAGSSILGTLEGSRVHNANLGTFNVDLAPSDTIQPQGHGFGTLTVAATGVKVNLTLADDKAVVVSLPVDQVQDGLIPVFAPLYGNKGLVSGWLAVTNNQISGSLLWSKAPNASATYFKEGFNKGIDLQGGVYTPPSGLAQWGMGDLIVDGDVVSGGYVAFNGGTYGQDSWTIPVSDGENSPVSWVITKATGLVTFYRFDGSVAGTGILVVDPAPAPGVYGFTTEVVDGIGTVHSEYSEPATP